MDVMDKKIYYHDTDCGGVVYYANYLKYFEEARTEYLSARGIDLTALSREGFLFVVKKVDIEYKSPARYADSLSVATMITKKRAVSLEFTQEVKRRESVLVTAKTVLVCIDSDFRPAPMPPAVAERLQ